MAISDINKAMALYAQPTQFDQNAWKTAFDIANAFTNAENNRTVANENARKHQENLATSDWRVKFQNNEYQTGIGTNNVKLADLKRLYNNALQTDPSSIAATISQNQLNQAKNLNGITEQQGIAQWNSLAPKLLVDEFGRPRINEQIFQLARQQQNLNPVILQQLLGDYQKKAAEQALQIAPYNPQFASNTRALAGLSDFTLGPNGDLINANSGAIMGNIADPVQATAFGGGYGGELAKKQAELEQAEAIKAAYGDNNFAERENIRAHNYYQKWLDKELDELIPNINMMSAEEFSTKMNLLQQKYGRLGFSDYLNNVVKSSLTPETIERFKQELAKPAKTQ